MNAVSSRSHSVFMLYITGQHEASGTVLQGSLNLIDLAGRWVDSTLKSWHACSWLEARLECRGDGHAGDAGHGMGRLPSFPLTPCARADFLPPLRLPPRSERLARSQADGQRAKEACSINKSLSSLGDVFQSLASKAAHVPYRNSRLTHLLQPCLGGTGKTLMFVNINPEPESAQETLCSLRFAAKVNACETAAKGGATRNVTTAEPVGVCVRRGTSLLLVRMCLTQPVAMPFPSCSPLPPMHFPPDEPAHELHPRPRQRLRCSTAVAGRPWGSPWR
jgi:hypothetical protein